MKRTFLFLAILFGGKITAQLDYNEFKGSISLERITTIHKNRNTIGYVSSVNIENKKTFKKNITVLDLNADELFEFNIEQNNFYLIETAYNGSSYAFLFLDNNEKSLNLKIYSKEGQFIKEKNIKINPSDITYFLGHIRHNNNYTGFNQFLHETNDGSFILMINSVEKNLNTCQIIKIMSDTGADKFYTYMTESPIYESNFLGQTRNQIYFSFEINGNSEGRYFTETLALNNKSMESVYEIQQLNDQDYFFFPKLALAQDDSSDKVKFAGYFFNAEKNMDKDFYDGFAFWSLEPKGDFISEKYISFQKDIYDLKFKNDNRGKDLGFLFLQNVFQDSKKNIYIVSEGYQKVASGSAISMTALSGYYLNNDYTRVKTYNLALSKFDADFNYKGTQIIDKQSNAIQLSFQINQPIFEVGKLYNRYGLFDYLGTEVKSDVFYIYFKNFKMESLSGGSYKIGRYSQNENGTVGYDNIEKLPNTDETYLLPNDDGRVLFVEKIKKTIYFDFKK